MSALINDVEYWRTRAKEARVIAEAMLEGASRQALLHIANDYEKTAQAIAEERLKKKEEQTLELTVSQRIASFRSGGLPT